MDEKSILRKKLQNKRRKLSPENVEIYSQKILENVKSLPFWVTLRSVHVYQANYQRREVSTDQLIAWLQKNPAINVMVGSDDKFAPVPNQQFDAVIVPVLGFDRKNYRIGLGAGWYDQFLALQKNAITIGLAYEAAKCESVPIEAHDYSLNFVVSEKTIYR